MPTIKQKAEQTLKLDDPGVAKHKFVRTVRNFVESKGRAFHSRAKHNSSVLGFRGENSCFAMSVKPFGDGFFKGKPKGETEVFLYFLSGCDIKMHVEWSASITDPSGKEIVKSKVFSTVFVKQDGKYENSGPVVVATTAPTADIRMIEDPKFALHKDIREKGWLFDGALHVVVDVLFKVHEGGITLLEEGNSVSRPPVNPLLVALQRQIDSPLFPDFTLISADGAEIKTHKLILTLQSPVFRAMFQNNLEESRTGICKIEDANAESIKAMLAFLAGIEPKEWSFEMARDLFELGDKYQLTALRTRAALELSKTLTTKNLVEVMLLAYGHSEAALLNETFLFLEDNIKKATLDGVVVRFACGDVPKALVRKWQTHWFRRQEGVAMEDDEDGDEEMDSAENDSEDISDSEE